MTYNRQFCLLRIPFNVKCASGKKSCCVSVICIVKFIYSKRLGFKSKWIMGPRVVQEMPNRAARCEPDVCSDFSTQARTDLSLHKKQHSVGRAKQRKIKGRKPKLAIKGQQLLGYCTLITSLWLLILDFG